MGVVGWSGARYWEGGEGGNIAAATLALANSIKNPIPHFLSESARNTAAAPLIADGTFDDVGMLCYVKDLGMSVYNGVSWEWVTAGGPADTYQFGSGDPATSLFSSAVGWVNNSAWAPATYTFTPTRTGWADVSFTVDYQMMTVGFGYASVGVAVDDVDKASFFIGHEIEPRKWSQWSVPAPIKLVAGTPKTLKAKVGWVFAAGGFGIRGLNWSVVTR